MVLDMSAPQRRKRNTQKPQTSEEAVANKPRKKKSHIVPHQNYLWQYFSTDQKKVLLNIKKTVDKT